MQVHTSFLFIHFFYTCFFLKSRSCHMHAFGLWRKFDSIFLVPKHENGTLKQVFDHQDVFLLLFSPLLILKVAGKAE